MKAVAIHQPQFLPWLPYFDKLDQADVFVYLDTTQYQKGGVQNRNQIRVGTAAHWLSVPVQARFPAVLIDVRIAAGKWRNKQVQTLRQAYARANHRHYLDELAELLAEPHENLVDLSIRSTEWLAGSLGIRTPTVRASTMNLPPGLVKTDLLVEICKRVSADHYLSGRGAAVYQQPADFRVHGIELVYQDYAQPTYAQHDSTFVSELSALDLLLHHGPNALSILRSGRSRVQPDA